MRFACESEIQSIDSASRSKLLLNQWDKIKKRELVKIKVIIFIMATSASIHAMEKPQKMEPVIGHSSPLDVLPPELQMQILEYITGNTLDEAVKGIKHFYIASPESRKDPFINKIILQYLMQKFPFEKGSTLQKVVKNLSTFPAFKDPEMIQWIEQEKIKLDNTNELRKVSLIGNIEKIKELINKPINIDGPDIFGDTALLNAARSNKTNVAQILIEKGANVNAQNSSGTTALFSASDHGNVDIVKALLAKGANSDLLVNPKSRSPYAGITPLIEIAKRLENYPHNFPIRKYLKAKEIIEELLKAKADPRMRDKGGKTAADYIRRNERLADEQKTELLELLQKYSKEKKQ